MAKRWRPTEETKIRRALVRAERAKLRRQARRNYLRRITQNAPKAAG